MNLQLRLLDDYGIYPDDSYIGLSIMYCLALVFVDLYGQR